MIVSPDLVPLVAGGALLAIAVMWRFLARRRTRRQVRRLLEASLRDPVPAVRRAAIIVAAQHGLSPIAQRLLDTSREEHNADVLDGIVEAVLRNQWEPCDHPRLLELRIWAQRRLDEQRPSVELTISSNGHGEKATRLIDRARRWTARGTR